MSDIRKFWLISVIIVFLIPISLITLNSDIAEAKDEIPIVRGEIITITATILQNGSYENPVQNQRIYFFDQTYNIFIGYAISDQNGIAFLEWMIPQSHPLGPTIINATFFGNESLSLAPSYQRVSLLILSQTHIELNQSLEILAPGDLLSFSSHLVDDSNYSVPNAQISVFKGSILLATGMTNTFGYVVFEIECNSSWVSLGENTIRISFEQDLINFLNSTDFTFTIEIKQISTYLDFTSNPSSEIELNTAIDLQMTLSEDSDILPGETLEATVNDIHLCFLVTDSLGQANLHTTVDEKFSLGTHVLKIHYNGTERYSESTLEVTITITSPLILDASISGPTEIGLNVLIKFTVSDLLNRPISNSDLFLLDISSNQMFSIHIEDETVIDFQYLLEGPSGLHTLDIEILGNPFISNNHILTNFTAWSRPKITLVHTGIDHYASPNQEIIFTIRLTDWIGNCSSRQLQGFLDNEVVTSTITNSEGLAIFTLLAPPNENLHNISITYNGNSTRFELTSIYFYDFLVTIIMPITIKMDSYEVVAPLRELSVLFTVKGLNGSLLSGVIVNFNWLSQHYVSESINRGQIVLRLAVPVASGSYSLYFESEPTNSIESTQGSVQIEISASDIMSIEGVGITGIAFVVTLSIGIVSIPVIRRRYIVG